jgi:hypothetical protein
MFQFFRSTHSGWNISILLFYSFRMERILLKCFNPSVLLIQDGKNFIKMFQSFRSTHSGWKEFYKNVSVLPFQSFHSTHSGWKEFYKNVSVLPFYSFRMERILQKCFSPSVLLIQDGKNFTKMFQSFRSTHSGWKEFYKNVSVLPFYSFRMERILQKCFSPSILLILFYIKMFPSFGLCWYQQALGTCYYCM